MQPRLQRAPRVRPLLLALACLLWTGAWAKSACPSGLITRLEARRLGRGAAIAILASGAHDFQVSSFTLASPLRLIFDLKDAALALGLQSALPIKLAGVTQARVGQFSSGPDVARIVLDLNETSSPPTWKLVRGKRPEETLIVLEPVGPVTLPIARVEPTDAGLAVRLVGASDLQRRTAALDDPPRVFTDLRNAALEVNSRKSFLTGPIREIRMAQQPPDGDTPVARLVVELREPQQFSESEEGDDLVITFGRPSGPDRIASQSLRGRKVVIDPGHGGSDPGSIGAGEDLEQPVYEKDIALDIGLRLAKLLQAAGAEVTLTRDKDVFAGKPSQRAARGNDLGAEALVSIHCNSCSKANALSGTMVLYHDLGSLPLAQAVQEELLLVLGTQDKGVRFRDDLSVLSVSGSAAILVETAFINHDGDRKLLLDPEMQEQAARAILQGLARFFSEEAHRGGRNE